MPNQRRPDGQSQKDWVKDLSLFAVITVDVFAYSAAGIAVGWWAWSKWNAPWWVLVITSGAGLFLAFYKLYALSKRNPE